MNKRGKSNSHLRKVTSTRTRPPLERMMQIHQAIQSGNFPSAVRLARDLEVSSKSIHRDVEFMQNRLNLPMAFDYAKKVYQ